MDNVDRDIEIVAQLYSPMDVLIRLWAYRNCCLVVSLENVPKVAQFKMKLKNVAIYLCHSSTADGIIMVAPPVLQRVLQNKYQLV